MRRSALRPIDLFEGQEGLPAEARRAKAGTTAYPAPPRTRAIALVLVRTGQARRALRWLRHLPAPQPARGDVGALPDRAQLEPHRRLDHPLAIGKCAEAAVSGGDHPLALADRSHRFLDAARDNLGGPDRKSVVEGK